MYHITTWQRHKAAIVLLNDPPFVYYMISRYGRAIVIGPLQRGL
jgi:hypothetical protein